MSPRRDGEAGFTFIEVLLAMGLLLVVLAATLAVFSTMERTATRNQRLNDEQLSARVATDALARRLRNLASPADPTTPGEGQQPLERAESQDLIFRTVNSEVSAGPSMGNAQNIERYRYCLSPDKKLYQERQTWTAAMPAMPATTACPGAGWPEVKVVAQDVVNGARPIWKYQVSPTPGTYSEQNSVSQASFPTGIAVRSELFIDPDTAHRPTETTLTTRVFLRNQNRPPVATPFSVSISANKVTLNASDAEDPEGNPLSYKWTDGAAVLSDWSARATFTFKAAAGSHVIGLQLRDVGNLTASPATRTITCTSTTCTG